MTKTTRHFSYRLFPCIKSKGVKHIEYWVVVGVQGDRKEFGKYRLWKNADSLEHVDWKVF